MPPRQTPLLAVRHIKTVAFVLLFNTNQSADVLFDLRYYEKAAAKAQSERPYYTDKSSFAVSRGQKWVLENKRPERLRYLPVYYMCVGLIYTYVCFLYCYGFLNTLFCTVHLSAHEKAQHL